MYPGYFIALEGVEGAGKSTQREFLAEYFKKEGFEVVLTREPGGTPFAEEIRSLLLVPRDEPISKKAELGLFFVARIQHIEMIIKPALERGAIVICDRFVDSTYAYQMAGRQLERSMIDEIKKWAMGDFKPDLTYIFELSPEIGLKRASARGKLDRFESEAYDFFERVSLGFMGQYQREPHRYSLIDADKSVEEVWNSVKVRAEKIVNQLRSATKVT